MKNIHQTNMKWWVGITACMVFFIGIGTFAYLKMDFIFEGVEITAMLDRDNNSSVAEITGNAKNAIYITLNGREIFIDRDGSFTEPVALLPGLAVVTLQARDKFGNTSEKEFEIVYKNNNQVALINK